MTAAQDVAHYLGARWRGQHVAGRGFSVRVEVSRRPRGLLLDGVVRGERRQVIVPTVLAAVVYLRGGA